jgi:DNA-binding GntR family transcriptional regulator
LNVQNQRLAPRAYQQILDLILSGETSPGDHLNERQLAERLGMSRTPVRDALLMLEAEGLIVRQGRMGVQIKQMRIDEFLDALQVRTLLEPAVSHMAAGKVDHGALDELEGSLRDALEKADATGHGMDRSQTRWIDDTLHSLISDSAGNPQLSTIVRNLRRKTQMFDLKNLPERAVATCHEHLDIIAALRLGDGRKTAEAMLRHLEQVRASIIARLSRE